MNSRNTPATTKAEKAGAAVESAKNKVVAASAEAADKAKAAASRAASDAKASVAAKADGAKAAVADDVSGVASALRTAANDMRDGSPQERTIGQFATGLADASDAIRDKDLGEVVNVVTDFARRNPLVFLGGAALVGFAASRFVKASQPVEPQTDFDDLVDRSHHASFQGDRL